MADGGLVKVDDKLFGLFNAVPLFVRCLNAPPPHLSLSLSRVFVRPSYSFVADYDLGC